ncbi:MAG: FAD-binding protein, partial [Eubacterium sp.]
MQYDVIIIGSGPAGLSAGIYAARGQLNTLILVKGAIGGQAVTTWEIENYPGAPEETT